MNLSQLTNDTIQALSPGTQKIIEASAITIGTGYILDRVLSWTLKWKKSGEANRREGLDCDAHAEDIKAHGERIRGLEVAMDPKRGERLAVVEAEVETLKDQFKTMDEKNDQAHNAILAAIARHP